MRRRVFALLTAVFLFSMVTLTAHAHDVPDLDRNDCTIKVVVRHEGKAVSGGEATAIRVGYVYEQNGNYTFRRLHDDAELENIQSAATAAALEAFYREKQESFAFEAQTCTVSKTGSATFRDLKTGLYLIVQDTPAPGYSSWNSFLVSVPYMKDGEYLYNVTAGVKTELEREPEPTESKPEETKPEETEPEETKPKKRKPVKDPNKLPQTGQLNWPVPVLTVGGLTLFAFGWWLRFGRKKEGYAQ